MIRVDIKKESGIRKKEEGRKKEKKNLYVGCALRTLPLLVIGRLKAEGIRKKEKEKNS